MIDLCKCIGVHIINGRTGQDKNVGKLTCMGNTGEPASTVDYILMSTPLFSIAANFKVDEFDELISDKHCPLILTLTRAEASSINPITNTTNLINDSLENDPKRNDHVHPNEQTSHERTSVKIKWKPEHQQDFREGFDLDK